MEDPKDKAENSTSPIDTTPKVTGIGGIFFFLTIRKKQKNGMPKI
ncbi:hypothetical protein LEP1GSC148_4046 [Leptospira interrogans serovar Canicola str. LT1962]|nr:hypothetical protein LEP1GSC148_4046 [Leptospira interrogans serovar Canicola str. LT1962]